ncbi:hypothetical protein FACS189416_3770 [Bacteroidia bacterium]|nr:hypothetical protein FACS189416_3770 [Bacteroidia bacterium]
MKYSNIMANDMNPFNIGIIGLSRSGKSVLMHSLGWGQSHSDYIKFYAKDMKTSLASRKTLECLEGGRWPCVTSETEQLNYTMTYNDCPVIDFSVTDYIGSILNSYDEIDQKERTEFYKYLENSAGLIFCVPSDTIIRILNGDDDAVEELEDLNDFIFKNGNIIKNIPVTIAITKSDLLENENENEKQAACEIIKEELYAFCEGFQFFVSLVFVTLGEGLGDGEQGSKITTENIYCRPMSDAFLLCFIQHYESVN